MNRFITLIEKIGKSFLLSMFIILGPLVYHLVLIPIGIGDQVGATLYFLYSLVIVACQIGVLTLILHDRNPQSDVFENRAILAAVLYLVAYGVIDNKTFAALFVLITIPNFILIAMILFRRMQVALKMVTCAIALFISLKLPFNMYSYHFGSNRPEAFFESYDYIIEIPVRVRPDVERQKLSDRTDQRMRDRYPKLFDDERRQLTDDEKRQLSDEELQRIEAAIIHITKENELITTRRDVFLEGFILEGEKLLLPEPEEIHITDISNHKEVDVAIWNSHAIVAFRTP